MIIRLKALAYEDNFDVKVECSQEEWEKLIAPTIANNWPIDGSTVESEVLDVLVDRPPVKGRAKHTIFIV